MANRQVTSAVATPSGKDRVKYSILLSDINTSIRTHISDYDTITSAKLFVYFKETTNKLGTADIYVDFANSSESSVKQLYYGDAVVPKNNPSTYGSKEIDIKDWVASGGTGAGKISYSGADRLMVSFQSAILSRNYSSYFTISIDYTDHSGNHTYTTIVEKEPTCTESGVTLHKCSVCGASYEEHPPATGHTPGAVVVENKVDATCTTAGSYDNVVYCTVCGAEISREKVSIPEKGHGYTSKKVEPTETTHGYTRHTCSRCGLYYDTDITYLVTFKSESGSTLKTEIVNQGSKATPPTAPEKADTAQFDYTFDGWYSGNNKWTSNTVISNSITYTAQYSYVTQEYTVRWYNYDGTLLETDENVPYGTKPTYNSTEPTKPGNAEHSYEFAGWDYDLNTGITGDKNLTAQFKEIDNTYTVRWLNADGEELEKDEWVPYNAQPDYNGDVPTMDDAQYDYTFIGWSASVTDPAKPESELEKVKGDITYTAVYEKTPKLYAITVILFDSQSTTAYEYGKTITIEAPIVEGYNFIGWTDGVADRSRHITVLSVATYEAVYEIKSYSLKLSCREAEGAITGVSVGTYNHGTSLTATAVPVKGYKFKYWVLAKGDGTETTLTDSTIQFNITDNITLGAVFEKIPPPDITFVQMLYQNKQISAGNKVPVEEYFRIVVGAVAYD